MLEVARCQSISKAAKELGISQQALSTTIQSLEAELDTVLFHRSPSGVVLTAKGAQIAEVFEELLQNVERVWHIAGQDIPLTDPIHIAAIPAICDGLLKELCVRAKAQHPQLTIETEQARPRHILQKVAKGKSNFGIMAALQEKQSAYDKLFQEKDVCFVPLFEDRLCLFTAAEHPLARQSCVTEEEIRQNALTCFSRECYLPMLTGDFLEMQSLEDILRHITYPFDDLDNIKKVAASGLAVAILPRRMALQDAFIRQHLVPVDIAEKNVGFIIGVIYRNGMLSAAENR
ncbi:MAG: LysR family transcriptional regulator, partial [Peptococcaceae bacterium]